MSTSLPSREEISFSQEHSNGDRGYLMANIAWGLVARIEEIVSRGLDGPSMIQDPERIPRMEGDVDSLVLPLPTWIVTCPWLTCLGDWTITSGSATQESAGA